MSARAVTEVLQDDLYTLLVGALRYALGRQSYIVGSTADLVRRYAKDLAVQQRTTLIGALRDHIESGWHDRPDPRDIAETWETLLRELEAGGV